MSPLCWAPSGSLYILILSSTLPLSILASAMRNMNTYDKVTCPSALSLCLSLSLSVSLSLSLSVSLSLSLSLLTSPSPHSGSGFESSEDRVKKPDSEEDRTTVLSPLPPPSDEPPSNSAHGYIQLQQQHPAQDPAEDPTTTNPLFVEMSEDLEKQRGAPPSPAPLSPSDGHRSTSPSRTSPHPPLTDLTQHPLWHPALPPGRLHHHYHRHHSHKLDLWKVPWVKFFTHTAPLALFVNTFAQGWVGLMILTEMPAFLHQRLGCDISHSGYLSILPYLCNLISVELFSLAFNWCMVCAPLSLSLPVSLSLSLLGPLLRLSSCRR
jgi:hypothetical protein